MRPTKKGRRREGEWAGKADTIAMMSESKWTKCDSEAGLDLGDQQLPLHPLLLRMQLSYQKDEEEKEEEQKLVWLFVQI